jgi:hypothetical protein
MQQTPQEGDAPVWWVQAGGRLWGPYGAHRLPDFKAERRLSPTTLVARSREGPFLPAGGREELAHLFAPPATDPFSGAVAAFDVPGTEAEATASPRPLLVIADLSAPAEAGFEALLGEHGPVERAVRGAWLVRAPGSAAALRNALSRRLGPEDRLLVLEAGLAQAAWFNLDGAQDRRLRRLWTP